MISVEINDLAVSLDKVLILDRYSLLEVEILLLFVSLFQTRNITQRTHGSKKK